MEPLQKRITNRLLMGPGPCNPPQKVLEAGSLPLLGHLDPQFVEIMDDLSGGLRQLFGTKNKMCIAGSGTGSAGMEILATNLIEEGDSIVVGVNGVFGGRIAEMCKKLRANVIPINVNYGEGITIEAVEKAIESNGGKIDFVWVVMAETSTGFLQTNLKEMAELTHKHGGLFLIDCVTGLGGCELKLDEWGIDGAFSGTQKCLGVPPCLSPVTMNDKAVQKVNSRKTPITSWYFDTTKLMGYWSANKENKRAYHHTAPVSSVYQLYTGVQLILEETLPELQKRYREAASVLQKYLESKGFKYVVKNQENRLPNLHCVYPPEDIDEAKLRRLLLEKNIEIGGGLGSLAGKAVRIGVMGANANIETVNNFIGVLDQVLPLSKI